MRTLLYMLLMFLITPVAFSQNGLKFEKRTHDFGEVQRWSNPGAVFFFTNKSGNDILFLPTFPRDDIFVKLPKGKIPNNASDTVFVYYFTGVTGAFEKSVELYTSNSGNPIKLTVKGNILSLDANAYVSCPGFAPKLERIDELALVMKDTLKHGQPKLQKTDPAPVEHEDVMIFEDAEPDAPAVPISGTETISRIESTQLPESRYSPNNIVFLIDVSSSMKKADKLPLLKTSMKNLAEALRKIDVISVVIYSSTSAVALPATTADNKEKITALIDSLFAKGFTNGIKGLETAYEIAEENFIPGGNNQIIIATDGKFNSPGYSENDLMKFISAKAENQIKLSVVAFGDDKSALKTMKKVSEITEGSFIQIPDERAANAILIEEVKLQSLRE